jgi:hypothetical protein
MMREKEKICRPLRQVFFAWREFSELGRFPLNALCKKR